MFRETLIEKPKVDELGESLGSQSKYFLNKFNQNADIESNEDVNEDNEDVNEAREEIFEAEYKIKVFSPNRQTKIILQSFPLPKSGKIALIYVPFLGPWKNSRFFGKIHISTYTTPTRSLFVTVKYIFSFFLYTKNQVRGLCVGGHITILFFLVRSKNTEGLCTRIFYQIF